MIERVDIGLTGANGGRQEGVLFQHLRLAGDFQKRVVRQLPFRRDDVEDTTRERAILDQTGIASRNGKIRLEHDHFHIGHCRSEERPDLMILPEEARIDAGLSHG